MEREDDQLDRLMAAAPAGDGRSYRAFLEAAAVRLRRYYARRLGDEGDVETLMQECLIACHEKRSTLDPARPVAPWLFAIARYKLVDHWRARGRRPVEVELPELRAEPDSFAGRDVDHLLARLPAAQSEAIRLTRIEGLTMKEASSRVGIGVSALKLRVHRGMARLRKLVMEDM